MHTQNVLIREDNRSMAIEASALKVDVARDFEAALEQQCASGMTLREDWDELLRRSVSNVVFLTWQWQLTWWRHFGGQNAAELHLLTMRTQDGVLTGIAPLYIETAPMPPVQEYTKGVPRPGGEGEPVR